MTRKVLYLMHVDWHWIKQRPHFLAEELAAGFDVTVVHPRTNRRTLLVDNRTRLRTVGVFQLPLARFAAVRLLNRLLYALAARWLEWVGRPDVVWLTFPTLAASRRAAAGGPLVVYDCMDDAAEFPGSPEQQQRIRSRETRLLADADLVFVSSENLRRKLEARGCPPGKAVLVRNALGWSDLEVARDGSPTGRDPYRVLYIGTVAEYVDFDALRHCADALPWVEFHFVGPVTAARPEHPRFVFHGAVDHERLRDLVRTYHCLIMPFVVNELIQGVDPVKLYEYIYFDKPIVACRYDEIERFRDFVHFYESPEALASLLSQLRSGAGKKYDASQRRRFLSENLWSARGEVVRGSLHERLSGSAHA